MSYNYDERYKNCILNGSRYLCCQPGYFADSLEYREFYVPESHAAYDVVSMFYEATLKSSESSILVIPDGCIDVVVSFRENQCAGISLCGTISTSYSMDIKDSDYIFGMRFMPGKFPIALASDNIRDFMDNQENFTMFDREWKFIERLINAGNFYERIEAAAAYINKICDSAGYKEKVVHYAMDSICRSSGNVSIKALSNELIYSPKYIENIFKEYTGFTPKNMCRLARAHKAAMMLLWGRASTKTMVSMECGYSDLSHMNRDLKNILGINSGKINEHDFYHRDVRAAETVYTF